MTRKEIKERDEKWRARILKRDKACIICGSTKYLQGAHIFSRSIRALRWHPTNGVVLCRRHHIFWQPNHPVEFTWAIEKKIGRKKLKELYNKAYAKIQDGSS